MTEPMITCPNCRHEIKLTESLAEPLLAATRAQFEARLTEKDQEVARRQETLDEEREKVAQQARDLEKTVEAKAEAARKQIAEQEAARAKTLMARDLEERDRSLADLRQLLTTNEAKLAEAQQAQAEMLKKQRELDEAKRELDLTVERRIREGLGEVQAKAKLQAEEAMQLRVREKEEQIAAMTRQIEDLKRRAEQGSQQLQGEVQELELEEMLRARFPQDQIEPVAKGEHGGDLVHRVYNGLGQHCGTILWESKRTKNWSDGWIGKLKGDQRASKADFALIVSHALPKDMTAAFDLLDGVWVTEPKCAMPVALALRESLIGLARARQASEGHQTKAELVYRYLTGPQFRHRVEAIVEKFTDMKEDLDRERKMMVKQWAKREAQITSVIETTAGMYGDLQGIAGRNLQEIAGLDMMMLEAPEVEAANG